MDAAGQVGSVVVIICSLQSFEAPIEGPGENQRDRKSEHKKYDHNPGNPIRDFQDRKDLRRDLDDEPAHHCVSDGSAIDLAPLQFGEE